jgi:transcriptional regulator with XRE-family HTH domain
MLWGNMSMEQPMAISAEQLGARVRQARTSCGLTQEQLALRVDGLDQVKLSRIENGQRAVSTLELVGLALALEIHIDDLVSDRPLPEEIGMAARFESHATPASVKHAAGRVEALLRVAELLTQLGCLESAEGQPNVPAHLKVGRAIDQGEAAAALFRRDLGLGDEPLSPDFEDQTDDWFGVHIAIEPLGDGIAGLCAKASSVAVALVNSDAPWGRQRFTTAHEVAHVVFGDLDDGGLHIDEDLRADGLVKEMRANAFATHLLMPASGLRSLVGGGDYERVEDILRAQFHFGVSREAIAWHLLNLGLADQSLCARVRGTPAVVLARGTDLADTWLVDDERRQQWAPPAKLYAAALSAYAEAEIGLGPIAELRNQSETAVREWAEGLDEFENA